MFEIYIYGFRVKIAESSITIFTDGQKLTMRNVAHILRFLVLEGFFDEQPYYEIVGNPGNDLTSGQGVLK